MTVAVVALAVAVVALVAGFGTFASLYAKEARVSAVEHLQRGEAELALAKAGAELRASQEQRERLRVAIARYSREIRNLEEKCVLEGDVAAIGRALGDLLSNEDRSADAPPAGPVPNWVASAKPGDSGDSSG